MPRLNSICSKSAHGHWQARLRLSLHTANCNTLFIQTVLNIFASKNTLSRIFHTRAHFLFIVLADNSQFSTAGSCHTSLYIVYLSHDSGGGDTRQRHLNVVYTVDPQPGGTPYWLPHGYHSGRRNNGNDACCHGNRLGCH